jgi:chitinase
VAACGVLACTPDQSSGLAGPGNPAAQQRRADAAPAAEPQAASAAPDGKLVIAYIFPKKTIDATQIAAEKLTHINYAFANVRDNAVVPGSDREAENLKQLTSLRARNPQLKILLSVGGWAWSGAFSDAALTPESRQRFVTSGVELVGRYDIDGLDIDWEYPGLPGKGNTHRPEDKQNFTALMAELRAALDAAGAPRKKHLLLTFAAGALPEYLEHTEMGKVQASVDFVNLMTYDFREADMDPEAGHHANLFTHPGDPKQLSADRMTKAFIAAGVPAAKLVLGVPFYGRAWGDVKDANQGLYQPAKAADDKIETSYTDLADQLVGRNGYLRVWDDRAQAPFLWNAEKRVFISYEDPQSLRLKCRYVRDNGLGGVMFWEYYSDRRGDLLGTLFTELRGATIGQK